MAEAEEKPVESDELIDLLTRARAHDWAGGAVTGAALAQALQELSVQGRGRPATLRNARVSGDVVVSGLGRTGELLTLQLFGCVIEGSFVGRQTDWSQLIIAKTRLRNVDLPACSVSRLLSLEEVVASGWLELRDAAVGRNCSISGSTFHAAGRPAAVTLRDTTFGGNLYAHRLTAHGSLDAERVRVEGDLLLDGATLHADARGKALSLTQARVGGRVMLSRADDRRFTAAGRIHLDSAEFGALSARGALLDGLGEPAIVADSLRVGEVVDLSGVGPGTGEMFEASGTLRFGGARIGGQFQLNLAQLKAAGDALVLQNARIDGDVLLGHDATSTTFNGTANLNALQIEGRLVAQRISFNGVGDGLAVRHAVVAGDVECLDLVGEGPFRLDNLSAAGIAIERLRLERELPRIDTAGLPDVYAHPAHALLDLSFVRLGSDLHIEALTLRGGDLRMIGAQVGSSTQLSRIRITETPGAAIIAQSASIAGGLQIAGAPDTPALIEGDFSAMNLRVGEDVTIVNARFGTSTSSSAIILRSADIRTGLSLVQCSVQGSLVASAAKVGGDLHLHASELSRPNGTALDLRGSEVAGVVQIASIGPDPEANCRVHGTVTMDGASVGSLAWTHVVIGDGTALALTNMTVRRDISANRLVAEGSGDLSLNGTSVAVLDDKVDQLQDGWGAGRVRLHIDDFAYGRLADPSGRNDDDADVVRKWRGIWLARRADARSSRPLRHLSGVLKAQGRIEASRLLLVDTFSAEGRARPSRLGRALSWLFGALFGHGLSGSRAGLTLVTAWLLGSAGVAHLQDRHLLVAVKQDEKPTVPCGSADPLLFAADAMLPLDLGVNGGCAIGRGPGSSVTTGLRIGKSSRSVLGEVETLRFLFSVFQLFSWVSISLAVLTWSGLLKRGGRD